jgi:membrane protein
MALVTTVTGRPPRISALIDAFEENDLLTSASAISFQVLTALVPFALFAFGVAGILQVDELWRNDLGPTVRDEVSRATYEVLDGTVSQVIGAKQLFWVTFGLILAIWQVSGAVRAVMGAFNRIYPAERERSFTERMGLSLVLAVTVGLLFIAAAAVVRLTPLLYDSPPPLVEAGWFVLRWSIAAVFLLAAVGLLVHYAPTCEQPLGWVSFGSVVVIALWIPISIVFGLYLRVANYDSIFGSLAAVVVTMAYIYLSAIVFLGGAQFDALVRASNGRGRR